MRSEVNSNLLSFQYETKVGMTKWYDQWSDSWSDQVSDQWYDQNAQFLQCALNACHVSWMNNLVNDFSLHLQDKNENCYNATGIHTKD